MGKNEKVSQIGQDIPWEYIMRDYCRVTEFAPLSSMEGNKVKSTNSALPYGFLLIENPRLPEKCSMPIVHKDDFRNCWYVYKERGIKPDEEVLVRSDGNSRHQTFHAANKPA